MKFYSYKKACALFMTGALTTGAAVPALAAEAETTDTAAEEAKTKAMTLEEIQELVLKNNRLQKTLQLNIDKVAAGLSAIDDGLKDLQDSQDSAAHAKTQARNSATAGQSGRKRRRRVSSAFCRHRPLPLLFRSENKGWCFPHIIAVCLVRRAAVNAHLNIFIIQKRRQRLVVQLLRARLQKFLYLRHSLLQLSPHLALL